MTVEDGRGPLLVGGEKAAGETCARRAEVARTTRETDISCALVIDGTGRADIATGVPFFDHMLEAFTRHGLFDLTLHARGDLAVDAHHTVEDCGIVLGQAIRQALGDGAGIARFGSMFVPMDEALVLAAIDISGRGQLHYDVQVPIQFIGTFDTTLAKEFFIALAANAGLTLHIVGFSGENAHHIIEAAFKAVGRALDEATAIDPRRGGAIPSTKGVL